MFRFASRRSMISPMIYLTAIEVLDIHLGFGSTIYERMHICMKKKKRKGKKMLPQGGSFGDGRIGPSVAAQSK